MWLQDDRFRGTTTRAASLNRYAYVEGAPESFVDVLGFYRARAAIRAQQLAAANAAYDAALKALKAAEGEYLRGSVSVAGLGTLPRYIAQGLVTTPSYQSFLRNFQQALAERERVRREQARQAKLGEIQRQAVVDQQRIADEGPSDWWLTKSVSGVGNFFLDVGDRGSTLVQYSLQTEWRRVTDPVQTAYDSVNGNILAEDTMALLQIAGADAELINKGDYCGTAGMCLTSNWTPVAYDSDGVAHRQAITIGHTVTFPGGEDIDTGWIEHEFTHVLQYEAMGGIGFGLDYGAEQLWGVVVQHESKETAYWNQSTEQMARAVEDDPDVEPGKNSLGHWFEAKG